jgi:hypothetical protein
MTIGIWQPYFFPYIGYFQLLARCDRFYFFDDVNFIKKGYIHRNKLWVNGAEWPFAIPIANSSQNVPINQHVVASDVEKWRDRFLKTLAQNYAQAPHYDDAMTMLEKTFESKNIAEMAERSVREVVAYLGLDVWMGRSSELAYDRSSDAQGKILSIARASQANHYLNPEGGRSLYEPEKFRASGIGLSFVSPDTEALTQWMPREQVNLSMLHWIMTIPPDQIRLALQATKVSETVAFP